jgi:hypothetical protein
MASCNKHTPNARFLHVPVGWLYVALFALQGAPASFVLLAYLYNAYVSGTGSLPEPDYLVAAYVAGLYYFWLVVALIRNDMMYLIYKIIAPPSAPKECN